MFRNHAEYRVICPGVTGEDVLSKQVTYEGDGLTFKLKLSLWDVDELLESKVIYLSDVNDVLKFCLDDEYKIHEFQLITEPHINKSKRSKMNVGCRIYEAQQPCGVEPEKTYVIEDMNDKSHVISRSGTPRQYLCKETLLYEFDYEALYEESEWNGTESM